MLFWFFVVFSLNGIVTISADAPVCKDTPHYYIEFDCKVVKTGEDGCPSRYECPVKHAPSAEKCTYQGKQYPLGERLPEPENGGPICSAGCFCASSYSGPETTQFTCAHIECPNLFRAPEPNCMSQYEPKKCCSTDSVCGNEKIEALPKCYFDGKEYRQHEKMYSSKLKCHTCYCDESFDNTTLVGNKNCYRDQCNSEVHYGDQLNKGCVPIYYGDVNCCASAWKCPSDKDTVIVSEERTSPVDEENQCSFGKLLVPIGDKISVDASGIECRCDIPPVPTCIEQIKQLAF